MNLKIGDKVKFLNDKGEGVIAAFSDKKTALVLSDDGFEIPYLIKELLKIEDETPVTKYSNDAEDDIDEMSVNQASIDEKIEENDDPVEDEEVVFAVQLLPQSTKLISYLINSSSYHLYYTVSEIKEGENLIFSHGLLEPDTKVRLGRLFPANINENMNLRASMIFFGTSFYRHLSPVQKKINLDLQEILNGHLLKENDYFDEESAVYTVYDFNKVEEVPFQNKVVNKEQLIRETETPLTTTPIIEKPKKSGNLEEVDLHIEAITDDYKDLSNGEILDIQMSRFKTSLETAIIHKTKKIVFIHGLGNGRLKLRIRRAIEQEYPRLRYQDASFKEYGYGATLVIIP